MHLLATDRLICPRCGPEFGLILFSERLEARRVYEGFFGCPNCREEYPIRGGFGDLRFPPRAAENVSPVPWSEDPESALRIAAFLGIPEGPGFLLLSGSSAAHARQIASMIDEIEVVAVHSGLRNAGEVPGVSRMVAGSILPLRSRTLRGIVLEGEAGRTRLSEGARTLAIGGRLVLLAPPDGAGEEIRQMGFDLLLDESSAIVGLFRGG
jgi:uncharacterized protein YbaR (Trm112 family)